MEPEKWVAGDDFSARMGDYAKLWWSGDSRAWVEFWFNRNRKVNTVMYWYTEDGGERLRGILERLGYVRE